MERLKIKGFTYTFRNATDTDLSVTEIDIDGVIGRDIWEEWITGEPSENTGEAIREKIRAIDTDKIIVNINSPGGDVNDGLMILDVLAESDAEVETVIRGMTASAGTIIPQSADAGLRKMSANALILIHKSMAGLFGYYNENELSVLIEDNKKVDKLIANVYAKRSGKSADDFLEVMNNNNGSGIWYDAEEALEAGLIDEIVEPFEEEIDEEEESGSENIASRLNKRINGFMNLYPEANLEEKVKDLINRSEEGACITKNELRKAVGLEDEEPTNSKPLTYAVKVKDLPEGVTIKEGKLALEVDDSESCGCKKNKKESSEDEETVSARSARDRKIRILKLKSK